ncbi:MAG: tetratricopeptide repeat-containing protein [Candidatus Heimdallarchaeota archaeon]|nr:tetratricopeptide repeat-containing protein [Candidatus Heimdallarchaeota archaeon]
MPKIKPEDEAKQHFQTGKKAFESGKVDDAFQELNLALNYYRQSNEQAILAEVYRMLGEIYYNQGKMIESRNHYKRAFQSFKSFNHKIGMADCYDKIAISFMLQDELKHAEDYQEKAIDIRKNTPDKRGLARGLKNLAIIKYKLGVDYKKALEILEHAMSLASKSKEPQLLINICLDKAKVETKLDLLEEAMKSHVLARRFSKKYSLKLPEESEDEFVDLLIQLGLKAYDSGAMEQSLKYLKNASLILKTNNKEVSSAVEAIIIKLEEKYSIS